MAVTPPSWILRDTPTSEHKGLWWDKRLCISEGQLGWDEAGEVEKGKNTRDVLQHQLMMIQGHGYSLAECCVAALLHLLIA